MYKKLFATLLSLCMVLTMLPVTALAADEGEVQLPEVEIIDIKNSLKASDPDLTFALNFAIKDIENLTEEYLSALMDAYGDWYTDYVLTISGLSDEDVTFNANGNADGYLAGQYDAWSENWVTVPFEDVTVNNGESLYIMEYAARLMGQSGLRYTLAEVAAIVQNFDCGVYFTPEFLDANPDMKVTLELKVFTEVEGEISESISVATNEFEVEDAIEDAVASVGDKYYFTLPAAITAAEAGGTVTLLNDVETPEAVDITKNLTIDLNGYTAKTTDPAGNGVFCVTGGTLILEDNSTDKTGKVDGVCGSTSPDGGYHMAVWAKGGNVVINGGTYTNAGAGEDDQYDLIYVSENGNVTINGGKFICDTPRWTLNVKNKTDGTISVKGGTFTGFDPSGAETDDNGAENNPVNYVASGYDVAGDNGTYTVHKTCTVTFKYNDNGATVDSTSTTRGGMLTSMPAEPTREDYTFGGWYTDEACTAAFDPSASITEDMTVYAKWTANQYTVTFDASGGSVDPTSMQVTYDSAYGTLPTPTRSGYKFNGWFTAASGGEKVTAETIVAITDAQTLYAQWTRKSSSTPSTPAEPETPTTPTVPETPSVDVKPSDAPTVDSSTTENADGSTTTTETKQDGTVVEKVESADGSTTTTETQTDGTVIKTETAADGSSSTSASKTEVTENKDGSTTTTTTTTNTTTDAEGKTSTESKVEEKVEAADGSVTTNTTTVTTNTDAEGKTSTESKVEEKVEAADGSVTTNTTTVVESEEKTEKTEVKEETVVKEDGTTETTTTSTTETELSNGSTGTTTVAADGTTTAEVTVSKEAVTEAAEAETPVALPMPAVEASKDAETAATITVTTNTTADVTVSIPVAEGTGAGTVAVIVNADGTETVITDSKVTEDGLEVAVPDGATIKVVDNSTDFDDVDDNNWESDAVAFTSARGIMNGTSTATNTFSPDQTTTRAMVWTMLARLSGVDTTPAEGEDWWTAGQKWAMENGISDGTDHNGDITREQLATMLHRYSGAPASDHDISHFDDYGETSDWALQAKQWAVENGIIGGVGQADGSVTLDPTGDATRAQVAQMFMNFMIKL